LRTAVPETLTCSIVGNQLSKQGLDLILDLGPIRWRTQFGNNKDCANVNGAAIEMELPMPRKYDAIIIGTGQSGPALAGRLNQEGLNTAVIERKLIGGTCVNIGCKSTDWELMRE
jgi:hypothetical protein